ncbi:sensor histidine kinase [Cohnella boryungensis]|uniref:Sensor histidine kinase n=1 Tax=Cohnella boryungensis TaxID=768479 RepID=A0ABV8SE38_9BACL
MRFWQSVRFKIVFGFFLIILPMVAFIIYNNLYAMKIVRQQISSNYSKLLTMNVRENDKMLLEFLYYLIRLKQTDPDIALIQKLPIDDSDYTFAKIRLRNSFIGNSGGMNYNIDSVFIYPRKEGEVFLSTQYSGDSAEKQQKLKEWAQQRLSGSLIDSSTAWEPMQVSDRHYLLKSIDMGFNVYAGILVNTQGLMRGLEGFDVGPNGKSFLMNSRNEIISSPGFQPLEDEPFRNAIGKLQNTYGSVKHGGESYLVLSQSSMYADLRYVIVMPETYILQNLPFFQVMLFVWIPLAVAVLLSFYLLLLQRVMFKPLVELIRGMRKIGQGRLDVRLPDKQSSEFAFMSGTFNQMAGQIEQLKIGIYEEQLRVQRAEYKHLQIQINPHFYMNCLNIIYNLAALKDFKSVQKLSLHLADYFRFLMHSHRSVVRLEDEIGHIRNYLEIHKLRFVTKMDYEIQVLPEHLSWEVSPLMIQPFVENAVIHGYNGREQDDSQFRIGIYSEADPEEPDSYIRIRVQDNGPGFPADKLRDLTSGDYLSGTGEQHLGIWNILRRFKMLYGENGEISFRNAPEGGAVVEVRLPLRLYGNFEVENGEPSEALTSLKEGAPHADDAGRGR